MEIASTTLKAAEDGSYEVDGTIYGLKESVDLMKKETVLYPANSELSEWNTRREKDVQEGAVGCETMVLEISALDGGRLVKNVLQDAGEQGRVGMLNFASAKNPGGGFLNGAQAQVCVCSVLFCLSLIVWAQEESIARSSTIYGSLMTDVAQRFYQSHRKDPKEGYYSHAIIWSPHVQLVRNDAGDWLQPVEIEMVTSCAVNAGVARRKIHDGDESKIEATMKERMARILHVFEKQGVENLVLGSFGTGVFRNNVDVVARIWYELLVGDEARFRNSFRRVVFAILGHPTYLTFKKTFEGKESPL